MSYRVKKLNRAVDALVRPPGSKSFTNRAVLISSLASGGVSRIHNPLDADDTARMRAAMAGLGVMIDDADDPWLVLGSEGEFDPPPGLTIDAGASGTTARFVAAACALSARRVTVDGTDRLRQRPIADLADALGRLGVEFRTTHGLLPVTVSRGKLHGGQVSIRADISSQFLSALLMIAPVVGETVEIEVEGGRAVSAPYVESTLEVMRCFGGMVTLSDGRYSVAPTGYRKTTFKVESDASAAAYPLVAAAITGGVVGIEGIPIGSTQPDLDIIDHLVAMGCVAHRDGEVILLSGPTTLTPLDADLNRSPDAVLALAVACLFASGQSRMTNVGTLRFKETDRLSALRTEIRRLGGQVQIQGDDLIITPGPLSGATIETYGDHRIAMAFAIAGLRVPEIVILDPGCVSKTWPNFFQMLEGL